MNNAVLFSSGLDSLIMRHYITKNAKEGDEFCFVYYNTKSRYSTVELDYILRYDDVIIDESFDFQDIEEQDAYVPN